MHILYIVGNRPQFIKLAILHKQVKQYWFIKESVIHTGQHFSPDMSDIFFKDLTIEIPIINLSIHSVSHIAMIGSTMVALEVEIIKLKPDLIVVFGDTNATLAGALTGKKLNIPIIHIEAGIRTFVEEMPEETNRYLTDRIADVNFCCTYLGMEHLKKEGFGSNNISSTVVNSGDLMLDAYYYFKNLYNTHSKDLEDVPFEKDHFILSTIHKYHTGFKFFKFPYACNLSLTP
jgi:UDP-GlcNAc3NAcA epimerase